MDGTKATALSKWCIENKLNFLRFDYSGHGVSKGKFEDGGISKWSIEAVKYLKNLNQIKILLSVRVWVDGFL